MRHECLPNDRRDEREAQRAKDQDIIPVDSFENLDTR